MSALVFPSAAVVSRVEGTAPIKWVGVASDLEEARAKPPRVDPAVYVVFDTRGGALKFSGPPIQQDRITRITFVTWVRHHGTAAERRAEMDAVLAALDSRMAGWRPGGNDFSTPLFIGSRDEFAHAQYLVTQTVFEVQWNFSANKQP